MLGDSSGGETHFHFRDNQGILKVSLIPVHAHEYHQLCYIFASVEFINGRDVFSYRISKKNFHFTILKDFLKNVELNMTMNKIYLR